MASFSDNFTSPQSTSGTNPITYNSPSSGISPVPITRELFTGTTALPTSISSGIIEVNYANSNIIPFLQYTFSVPLEEIKTLVLQNISAPNSNTPVDITFSNGNTTVASGSVTIISGTGGKDYSVTITPSSGTTLANTVTFSTANPGRNLTFSGFYSIPTCLSGESKVLTCAGYKP